MAYVDVAVAAVPTDNKQQYLEHAKLAADVFKKHGALSVTECWGDDIPEGDLNSMHSAVMRKPDETVVVSWISWASKDARNAAWGEIMQDSSMPTDMPFDGKRLIFGAFDMILQK